MSELWQFSARELAETIRTGRASSREVLQAHFTRVDAVNGHLNAVVRRLDDEAFAAADAADAAVAAGDELGPLHGVPCSIKENIDVAGTPTTQGVVAFTGAIDAPTTARMRAAGLPVGVQVMGDRWTDLRCLTVAAEIESLVGTITPIDPITA